MTAPPPIHPWDTPTDLEAAFAAALNNRAVYLHPSSFSYQQMFWQPYLGLIPFSLWRTLLACQEMLKPGRGRWPSIDVISEMTGYGDRSTILGREATASRPRQDGALSVLVAELIVTATQGAKHYAFEVRPHLPMLAPTQVKTLPRSLQKLHQKQVIDKLPKRDASAWKAVRFPTLVGVG